MDLSLKNFGLVGTLIATVLLNAGCQTSKPATETSSAASAQVDAPAPPNRKTQEAMTPEQALAELRAGNARFVSARPLARNYQAEVKATAAGQYPYAVVLSCLDSRQPIEVVFDQGIGRVFSARVAGNVLNTEMLGSMEFGCKVSGAKLIAVIGHTGCGAIKGAADNVEFGNLTELLARIKPAVEAVPADVQPRNSRNNAFIQQVADANVHLVMRQIRERSPALREMLDEGKIKLVGGMYDLSTGEVHFFEK